MNQSLTRALCAQPRSRIRAPKHSTICLALFAAFHVNAAHAQTQPSSSDPKPNSQSTIAVERVEIVGTQESYRPSTTTTSTKTDTPNLLTPQAIQTVPRAVLNEQKAVTLTDAVRNVSGVANDFGFNGNAQPLLVLRGFPSTSMTASSPMSGSSTYYLDGNRVKGVPVNMADVQAVEVVKGPASVLYGRSEPGGLVNVVRRPLSATTAFSLDQTIGEHGLTRTVLEGSGALNADQSLLARANLSYVDGGSPRKFVEDNLAAGSATLGWRDALTSVSVSLNTIDQRYRTDFGVPIQGTRPIAPRDELQYNDSPELSRIKSNTLALNVERRLGDTWLAKLRLLSQRADTREVDVTPYRVNLDTFDDCSTQTPPQMCRYYFSARPDGRVELDQATLDITGKFATGALNHSILATLETQRSEKTGATYLQALPSVDFFNPKPMNTPRLDTASAFPTERDDLSRWTSFTLQDQIDFGSLVPGLHCVFALRHDRTAAVYAAKGTAPNKVNETTPRVGVVYQLAPNQSVYAQYQTSLAANNGRNPKDGAALEPERAKQFEFGYKAQWFDGALATTLAAYQLEKKNLADFSLFFAQNTILTTGKARSRGIEFDALGQLSERVSVIASYAYTDTEVLEDAFNRGKQLANVPKHSGSVWARYALGAYTFGGGVFAQSQRQGDTANTFQLPGYATVDLMASYAFRVGAGRATVQANLKNAFNRTYFTGSHQFVSDWVAVGAPRTASVSLRYDF
jgi:iron complex outermembrane recepter protein